MFVADAPPQPATRARTPRAAAPMARRVVALGDLGVAIAVVRAAAVVGVPVAAAVLRNPGALRGGLRSRWLGGRGLLGRRGCRGRRRRRNVLDGLGRGLGLGMVL